MKDTSQTPLRVITLCVDDEWFKLIQKMTADVYEGETCEWFSVEEI